MTRGYFRFPAVFRTQVVFTSEDDLWEVPLDGGAARRLTAGRGSALYPCYSPDGRQLAFSSAEEGHNEVYVMPSEGGDLRRLTYLGAISIPCGWLDAETVLFRSTAYEAHNVVSICSVGAGGGLPTAFATWSFIESCVIGSWGRRFLRAQSGALSRLTGSVTAAALRASFGSPLLGMANISL